MVKREAIATRRVLTVRCTVNTFSLTPSQVRDSLRSMKSIRVTINASVLVSDEDFYALNLDKPMALNGAAYRIQSWVGEAPLFDGRESAIQVSAKLDKSHYATEPVTSCRI